MLINLDKWDGFLEGVSEKRKKTLWGVCDNLWGINITTPIFSL